MKNITTKTPVTNYNAKVVNRIDRVILVLAVAASAVLIFAGANANQDADASMPEVKSGMIPAHSGSVSTGVGGSLDIDANARVSITSSGGTLNPEG